MSDVVTARLPSQKKQAIHRRKRRAAGLCGREGCPHEAEAYYCERHTLENRIKVAYWRQRRKAHG